MEYGCVVGREDRGRGWKWEAKRLFGNDARIVEVMRRLSFIFAFSCLRVWRASMSLSHILDSFSIKGGLVLFLFCNLIILFHMYSVLTCDYSS